MVRCAQSASADQANRVVQALLCQSAAGAGRRLYRVIEGATPQEAAMRRTWIIIGVADVARSFAWYQTLLGLPKSAAEHDDFGQILDADGTVLLCLHQWGAMGILR